MKETGYRVPRNVSVCGTVGLCAMKLEDCVGAIFALPTEPESASVNVIGVPAFISAKEDPELCGIFNGATIAPIDGMPLVKLARREGIDCERCSGPELMERIFAEGVKRGSSHYFYGGRDDSVLEKLRENLEKRWPGIRIVGMYSPPFRPLTEEEDARVCAEIRRLKPDFVWVGVGAPKQERWIHEHRKKISGTVMLGVGAGFDFFAGTLSKAPEWIQKAGFEWFYRLCREPKRLWRRYVLGGFKFLYYRAEYALKRKPSGRKDS